MVSVHFPAAKAAMIAFLAAATATPAGAFPAPEYGPEAEARFLEQCAPGAEPGATQATRCRCVLVALQGGLGYPAFLAFADGGPAAFDRAGDSAAGVAMRTARAACGMGPASELASMRSLPLR